MHLISLKDLWVPWNQFPKPETQNHLRSSFFRLLFYSNNSLPKSINIFLLLFFICRSHATVRVLSTWSHYDDCTAATFFRVALLPILPPFIIFPSGLLIIKTYLYPISYMKILENLSTVLRMKFKIHWFLLSLLLPNFPLYTSLHPCWMTLNGLSAPECVVQSQVHCSCTNIWIV